MDVTLLGPSIMALGQLCKEANKVANGERTAVRVVIHADVKGNCVTLRLEVIQSIWNAAKDFVDNRDATSAKTLLEWLGLVGVPVKGGYSLIKYLIWKKDRQVTAKKITLKDGSNYLEISVEGDHNTINISPEIFKLSESPEVVKAVKDITAPVSEENGITEASFYQKPDEQNKIDQNDAASLQKATVQEKLTKTAFTAHITVYAPVLDAKSRKWRFLMNGEHPYMDISETTIAVDTMQRGGVRTGDCYTAEIEKTERTGKEPEFKVKRVVEFRPGQNTVQTTLI